ncbi:hypothetical protein MASR1M32_10240 [Rhodobacter sp.]
MFNYWPLFALGLLCLLAAGCIWHAMTAPLPPVKDPRKDWADWERTAAAARAKREGGVK